MRRFFIFILFGLCLILSVSPAFAQGKPVVQIVFFLNPDCENCQLVLTSHLPPLQARYGSQLEIMPVDTSKPDGIHLYQAMFRQFNLSGDRLGTPAIVLGTTVLVGAEEIPARLPGLIEEMLANGGVNWPNIPGLTAYISTASQTNPNTQVYPQPQVQSTETNQTDGTSIWGRFATNFKKDITANSLAVAILIAMLISLVAVVIILIRSILSENPTHSSFNTPSWVILILIMVGLGIASYLTFVEVGKRPAVCGPVGHCNEVQNSPYATLFGFLPVGVLGVLGYVAILISWGSAYFGPIRLRSFGAMALWGLPLFGVAFSIYLTFLEPFVIGASCVWCLSSAVVMTALLWLATPGLQNVLSADEDGDEDEPEMPAESVV